MKKEIEYITLSSQFIKKLITQLKESETSVTQREVKDALLKLSNGDVNYIVFSNEEKKNETKDLVIESGELVIYVSEHRVTKNNEEVPLTPKEFEILYFLINNKGQVFTKEEIYQAVWKGEYFLDEGTVMSFIRKLRKKIETNPDDPVYIQTVWGIGYKFNDKI